MSWQTATAKALFPILDEARKLVAEGKLKEARKLVRDAYPFGDRAMHPYKVWSAAVKKALPGLYPQRTHPVNEQGVPLFQ